MSNRFYPNQQFPPLPPYVAVAPALPPPPDGTKPRISITFWEDENTLCYQVDARGIPVSRRQDTNFINGTKLLNVSHMTRGRRDGILKGEQIRYVVKIGAMNLKGVWIPFERALELAKSENIYDELEPLFIPDIKSYYDRYYSKLDERQNPRAKAAVLADQRRQQQLQEQYWNYAKQLPHQPNLPPQQPLQPPQQYYPYQYFPPPPPQQLPHLYNKQQYGYQPYFPLAQAVSPPQPQQQQQTPPGPDAQEQ